MKKSRYSDSQIMAILKQAESGVLVPQLCREHGMSSASLRTRTVDSKRCTPTFSSNVTYSARLCEKSGEAISAS